MLHLNAFFISASIYKLQLVDICALQPSIGTTCLSQLLDRHAQLSDANWVFKYSGVTVKVKGAIEGGTEQSLG